MNAPANGTSRETVIVNAHNSVVRGKHRNEKRNCTHETYNENLIALLRQNKEGKH
jgi:hypothetical protein